MSPINDISVEPYISGPKPKKNLTLQDAIIAIAVYAGQMEPPDYDEDVKTKKK